MRKLVLVPLLALGTGFLAGCEEFQNRSPVDEALKDLNVIDESNLNEIMLAASDPNEAVAYFQKASAENPDRIDLKRGLATALIKAKKTTQGTAVWAEIVNSPSVTNDDRVEYADALIRGGDWDGAEAQLDKIAPTFETYKRYRLEAMVADSNKEWTKADSFYEVATGLTTRPAGVLNNWGYSKLTRGDFVAAENLFADALKYDADMFTAKNNLVLARGAQRIYELPIVPMTQIERAQLLHTMALAAIKQGDLTIGRGLLQEAIDTHPQHFEAAVRALRALENNVTN